MLSDETHVGRHVSQYVARHIARRVSASTFTIVRMARYVSINFSDRSRPVASFRGLVGLRTPPPRIVKCKSFALSVTIRKCGGTRLKNYTLTES